MIKGVITSQGITARSVVFSQIVEFVRTVREDSSVPFISFRKNVDS